MLRIKKAAIARQAKGGQEHAAKQKNITRINELAKKIANYCVCQDYVKLSNFKNTECRILFEKCFRSIRRSNG